MDVFFTFKKNIDFSTLGCLMQKSDDDEKKEVFLLHYCCVFAECSV